MDTLSEPVKILVIGAGAMGTFFAALLSRSPRLDVTLVAKTRSAAARLRKNPPTVSGKTRLKIPAGKIKIISALSRPPRSSPGNRPADIAIIFVKSYDTASASRALAPFVGKNTVVVTFQNGLGNAEIIKEVLAATTPRDRRPSAVLAGSTTHGAAARRLGGIFHTGKGDTFIAYDTPQEKKYARTASHVLSSAGIKTSTIRGSARLLWSKLVINSAVNPVGAVFNQTNGEMLANDFALELAAAAARETSRVARALGVKISPRKAVASLESVLKKTAANKNSMLQDIVAGRPTEINFISGAVVRAAASAGLAAPYNKILLNSVSAVAPPPLCPAPHRARR